MNGTKNLIERVEEEFRVVALLNWSVFWTLECVRLGAEFHWRILRCAVNERGDETAY